jgi:hypothetical protein
VKGGWGDRGEKVQKEERKNLTYAYKTKKPKPKSKKKRAKSALPSCKKIKSHQLLYFTEHP